MNEHRRRTVILSAWIDPVLRDRVRLEAARAGLRYSVFIERALREAVTRSTASREEREFNDAAR